MNEEWGTKDLEADLRADYGDDCSLGQAYWRGHFDGHMEGSIGSVGPWVPFATFILGNLLGSCFLGWLWHVG